MKLILIAIITAILGSCATKESVWVKPNSTNNEFYMDQGQCNSQALSGTGGVFNMGTAMIFNTCMQGKGWYLEEREK